MASYKGKVLSIAGSDSGGGAGIQADIKTITMLGCYAASCITSITAQNTTGVYGVWNLAPEVVEQQIATVVSDIKIDSIKIGMLPVNLVETVSQLIPHNIPVVLDPVMVSTSGHKLVETKSFPDSIGELFKKTCLITPNISEAEIIAGMQIHTIQDMVRAGEAIRAWGVSRVLVKGGDLNEGEHVEDVLLTENGVLYFKNPRISQKVHGTGCTLSSAIASFIAQGMPIEQSVKSATDYLARTISTIPEVGQGFNPVFHNYDLSHSAAATASQSTV
ncbi:MAG: bifunctional hydroxymethylpyrimidine kinase/phosphomethylpyrimidine kinase [Anaplasma sp.]